MSQQNDHAPVVRALLLMVQAKHVATRDHMENVSRYCGLLARELNLSPAEVRRAELAGLLHDVGKVAIPDSVLTKPGPLDLAEIRIMMRHAEIGAALVLAVGGLDEVSGAIRFHHEWFDGKGYPDGLAGLDIPLDARMIAVADAFDTMTTPRPFRRPVPVPEAMGELERCAGSQFDPVAADAFVRLVRRAWDAQEPWVRQLGEGTRMVHPVRFQPLVERLHAQSEKKAATGD